MKNKTLLFLYGSTGDLSFRKILPAIVNLFDNKLLNNDFKIIALGRRDFNKSEYIKFMESNNESLNLGKIENYLEYLKMEITKEDNYNIIKKYIDENSNSNYNIIHFLALSPNYMLETVNYLVNNKIVEKNNINHKVMFEKPFGNNLLEATKLNNYLSKRLNESQIFRIDHYLGKDFVNKIMYYRFKSNIFTSIFDTNNLKQIDIVLKEKDGILNRGNYFDKTGIVKDMFQGHILQMISLLTMNKPKNDKTESIIKEKINVLRKVKIDKKSLIFGQYTNYLEEANVEENSKTETLFKGTFYVNNYYKNVPINVFVGKKLFEKKSYIKLTLKDNSKITLNMYPNSSLSIISKLKYNNINYYEEFETNILDYSNVINSALNNNKHLFVSNEEVILSWKIAEEILKYKEELLIYTDKYEEN